MTAAGNQRIQTNQTDRLLLDLLAAVEAQSDRLERIERLLLAREPSTPRHETFARVVARLAITIEADDPSFSSAEVLHFSTVDHELAEALAALRATTTDALGTLFREMKDRDFNGIRLQRDGRLWRLVRT